MGMMKMKAHPVIKGTWVRGRKLHFRSSAAETRL